MSQELPCLLHQSLMLVESLFKRPRNLGLATEDSSLYGYPYHLTKLTASVVCAVLLPSYPHPTNCAMGPENRFQG